MHQQAGVFPRTSRAGAAQASVVAALSRDVVFGRVAAGTYALASLATPRLGAPAPPAAAGPPAGAGGAAAAAHGGADPAAAVKPEVKAEPGAAVKAEAEGTGAPAGPPVGGPEGGTAGVPSAPGGPASVKAESGKEEGSNGGGGGEDDDEGSASEDEEDEKPAAAEAAAEGEPWVAALLTGEYSNLPLGVRVGILAQVRLLTSVTIFICKLSPGIKLQPSKCGSCRFVVDFARFSAATVPIPSQPRRVSMHRVQLMHLVLDGPAVRACLDARLDEAARVRKLMWDEAKADSKQKQVEGADRARRAAEEAERALARFRAQQARRDLDRQSHRNGWCSCCCPRKCCIS